MEILKQFLNVKGTQESIANLEVNTDTVYIRSNIERVESEDFTGWQYDEIQYSLREYQELIGGKTDFLQMDVNDVAEMVSATIEDTISVAELVGYLLEQNMELLERVEQLENGGNS